MKMLDFKLGKLYIKHMDMLMNYETFMPLKSVQLRDELQKQNHIPSSNNIQLAKTEVSPLKTMRKKQSKLERTSQGDFQLCKGDKEFKLHQFVETFEKMKLTSDFMKFVQQRNQRERDSLYCKLMKRAGKQRTRTDAAVQAQTEPIKKLLNQQSRNSELSMMRSQDIVNNY